MHGFSLKEMALEVVHIFPDIAGNYNRELPLRPCSSRQMD